jgi:hypothetical protein
MELKDLTRADLARKLCCSRARITQLFHLLHLALDLPKRPKSTGDHWNRQTEGSGENRA